MQKRSDDTLVAYLDGELDSADRQHVEAWLAADDAARDRLAGLAQSATLVRSAYADIVNEPVPARLIAAARGETSPHEAEILVLKRSGRPIVTMPAGRWGIGIAAAAGWCWGGGRAGGGYLSAAGGSARGPPAEQRPGPRPRGRALVCA